MANSLLKFTYSNWRGDTHEYIIRPTDINFGPLEPKAPNFVWLLSGEVISRDDDTRPEMGSNRRRTFVLLDMENMEEVNGE